MCVTRDAAKPDTTKMDSLQSALTCGPGQHKVKKLKAYFRKTKEKDI